MVAHLKKNLRIITFYTVDLLLTAAVVGISEEKKSLVLLNPIQNIYLLTRDLHPYYITLRLNIQYI